MPYKLLTRSYRIIGGIKFQQWTDYPPEFPAAIAKAKAEGRRYRLVKLTPETTGGESGQRLFLEVLPEQAA